MNFPITLDPATGVPIWKQLFTSLREAILSGRLQPGETMPSTRRLSQSLRISRDTVVRCYEDLSAQGYITTIRGGATVVAQLPSPGPATASITASPAPKSEKNIELSHFARRMMDLELSRTCTADSQNIMSAAPLDLLPSRLWREIFARHCSIQDVRTLTQDEEALGSLHLRESIASYLRRSKALRCDADQIIVFADSQHPLDFLVRVLLNPGDTVAVETPGYRGARDNLLSHGVTLQGIPIDEDGLVVGELSSISGKCKLAYVTPSHHDPTGVVMSMSRRRQLLSWASRNGAWIVEDAFDSDYCYGSQPLPALQGMDESESVIYIYSFWKTLFPLSMIACLVVPRSLAAMFHKAKLIIQRNYPVAEYYTLADFLAEGHLERHIRKSRDIYAKRRQALLFALTQHFKSAVTYYKESAGLHAMIRLDVGVSEEEILGCAAESGLPMMSTKSYYLSDPLPGEFLIPFAWLKEEFTARAVERLAQLLGINKGIQSHDGAVYCQNPGSGQQALANLNQVDM